MKQQTSCYNFQTSIRRRRLTPTLSGSKYEIGIDRSSQSHDTDDLSIPFVICVLVDAWSSSIYMTLIFQLRMPNSSHSSLRIQTSCIESSRVQTTPPRHVTSRGSRPLGAGKISGLMDCPGALCCSCDSTLNIERMSQNLPDKRRWITLHSPPSQRITEPFYRPSTSQDQDRTCQVANPLRRGRQQRACHGNFERHLGSFLYHVKVRFGWRWDGLWHRDLRYGNFPRLGVGRGHLLDDGLGWWQGWRKQMFRRSRHAPSLDRITCQPCVEG
jgi:hypothetical protein